MTLATFRHMWLATILLLAVTGAPEGSLAQYGANVERGQDIAQRNCAGCHPMTGLVGGEYQGKYVPSFPEIARLLVRSPDELKAFVLAPHRPMPGLPLTVKEVDDLVVFIRSLQATKQPRRQ